MKINELVCPRCGQRCFTNCAYTTCDRCQAFFYAGQQVQPMTPIDLTGFTGQGSGFWWPTGGRDADG